MYRAVHFIGFKDPMRWNAAVKVFGLPDIIHRYWDVRAQKEIMEGDIAVFAKGDENTPPSPYSYDDSAHQ